MPHEKEYVVFGHGDFFGDIADIIHCLGGRLKKMVLNVPEPTTPGRRTAKERLARFPYPVGIEQIESFTPAKDEEYAIGFVGHKREPLVRSLKLKFASLIHPTAFVSSTATIGAGVVVNAGAVVAPYVTLEDHVVINRAASIGHDSHLEKFVVVNPGAHIAGSVRVGFGSVVSMGASVVQGRRVGRQAVIAAGAVVLEDVPDRALVAGVPAVVKRINPE